MPPHSTTLVKSTRRVGPEVVELAAVGDLGGFPPERLVSYLGLNLRVRQSGGQPASHGRITKQGRAHARGMLVEAAWAPEKTSGPLRVLRARARPSLHAGRRRGHSAQARHPLLHLIVKEQDDAFARPSLTAKKLRALELRAGEPSRRGQKGKAAAYSLKEARRREREIGEQAERAYRHLVAN